MFWSVFQQLKVTKNKKQNFWLNILRAFCLATGSPFTQVFTDLKWYYQPTVQISKFTNHSHLPCRTLLFLQNNIQQSRTVLPALFPTSLVQSPHMSAHSWLATHSRNVRNVSCSSSWAQLVQPGVDRGSGWLPGQPGEAQGCSACCEATIWSKEGRPKQCRSQNRKWRRSSKFKRLIVPELSGVADLPELQLLDTDTELYLKNFYAQMHWLWTDCLKIAIYFWVL